MINKIRIENVKGYDVQGKDLNVNLDPTKINLCVAPNGFGKSSLATAFESLKKSRLEISEDNKHIGQKKWAEQFEAPGLKTWFSFGVVKRG